MIRTTLTLTLLTLAIGAPPPSLVAQQDGSSLAGHDSPNTAELAKVDSRIGSRFPASVAVRIHGIVDSARAEGLPTGPLILRALEGGAKGVPADRIYVALNRLRHSLNLAANTLGRDTPAGDLATAATALQTGLPASRIIELRNLRQGSSLTVPLGAYLDLVARGAVPQRAWDRVVGLARSGAANRAYQQIDSADLVARQPGDRR